MATKIRMLIISFNAAAFHFNNPITETINVGIVVAGDYNGFPTVFQFKKFIPHKCQIRIISAGLSDRYAITDNIA
jgi:hypothetical protein